MGFIKFLLGFVLVFGSLAFGFALIFATPFTGLTGPVIFWGIVIFVAFIGGIYLIRHH